MTYRGFCPCNRDGATLNNTTATLTLPAGCVPGDVFVAEVIQNSTANSMSGFAGTTILAGPIDGTTVSRAYLLGKTLTAADITAGSFLFTWNNTGRTQAAGVVHSGVTLTGAVVQSAGSAGVVVMPAVTTVVDNCDLIQSLNLRIASGAVPACTSLPVETPPDYQSNQNTSSGANNGVAIGHGPSGPAGTYGSGTPTFAFAPAAQMVGFTVALPPTAAPPASTEVWGQAI